MLTMAPLPLARDAANPRASTSGAKKFSSNTARQALRSPLRHPSRSLIGVLGETPALLTRECSGPPASTLLASRTKSALLSGSPRSAAIWWVQLGAALQSSGIVSREQVITRQPSWLKRWTVAWPIPRLAPVRMTVFLSGAGVSDMPPTLHYRRDACQARHGPRKTSPAAGRPARPGSGDPHG